MKSRFTFIMALLLMVVLFTLQNTEMVNIQFFIWSYEISRALLIFLVLTVGILLGLFAGSLQRRKEERSQPPFSQKPSKDSRHDQHENL